MNQRKIGVLNLSNNSKSKDAPGTNSSLITSKKNPEFDNHAPYNDFLGGTGKMDYNSIVEEKESDSRSSEGYRLPD